MDQLLILILLKVVNDIHSDIKFDYYQLSINVSIDWLGVLDIDRFIGLNEVFETFEKRISLNNEK